MKFSLPSLNLVKLIQWVDEQINKIPDEMATIGKRIALGILLFLLVVAAYYGWNLGMERATPAGLEIGKDTKSLFMEEVEGEYNRKRKNIQMGDLEISNSEELKMDYEKYSNTTKGSDSRLFQSSNDLLEGDRENLYKKNKPNPPLLPTEGYEGYIPDPSLDFPQKGKEDLPGVDARSSLDAENPKILQAEEKANAGSNADASQERLRKLNERLKKLEAMEKKGSDETKRELLRPQPR